MSGGEEEEEAVLGQPVLTADEAQMKPRLALQSSSQATACLVCTNSATDGGRPLQTRAVGLFKEFNVNNPPADADLLPIVC